MNRYIVKSGSETFHVTADKCECVNGQFTFVRDNEVVAVAKNFDYIGRVSEG